MSEIGSQPNRRSLLKGGSYENNNCSCYVSRNIIYDDKHPCERYKNVTVEVCRAGKKGDKNVNFNIQRVKVPYLDEEERNIVIIETK